MLDFKKILFFQNKKLNKFTVLTFFVSTFIFANIAFAFKAKADCAYDGTNFYQTDNPAQITTPIYRLYNIKNGAYLYTRGSADANNVMGKWNEFQFTDGVPAFCTSLSPQAGLTPIYRLYNTKNGMYLYTRGDADKDHVLGKWAEFEFTDGVPAFYASLTPQAGLTPIYRLYNTKNGAYLYARGDSDKNHVMNTWPEFEFTDGIPAFYADLTNDAGPALIQYQGPEISVGLWYYSKTDIQNSPFQIDANKNYNIKDSSGNVIAQISANTTTSVSYDDNDNKLKVSNSSLPSTLVDASITFDAIDGDNTSIIFNVHKPGSNNDHYRGKVKVQYYRGPDIVNNNTSNTVTQIWVINSIPLEQYVWGMGETTGTGPLNHTQVMTTMFRTYGSWYIKYATKYAPMGFKIRSDSGSQIYYGYDWETAHANIKIAAQNTRGVIAMYGGDVALTPYSSWSDGRTRSWQEVWGGSDYPWCVSVNDSYGKHPSLSTQQLQDAGNHMVGLVANGSLNLANSGWDWQKILKYYYTGISLPSTY